MRICYISKPCIGHFTPSDAIYHVPLSLARRYKLTLIGSEGVGERGIAPHLDRETIIPRGGFWAWRAYKSLKRLHARAPFDLAMTGIDESGAAAGWMAQAGLGIPWIAICEDHPFQARYDRPSLRGAAEKFLRTMFLRASLRYPRKLLYFIEPEVLDFLAIKPEIMAPLHNSADMETLDRIREEIAREGRNPEQHETETIAYVGLVNEPKGGTYMLEVFARVAETRPQARLILIGRVDPDYEPAFRRMAEDRGLKNRIVLTGQVSSDGALREAARSDVCIHAYSPLPWLYHNQVLKVLEYMGLGRAVVSVDFPGTRGQITDGVNGLLAPYGDHDAMANAVARVLGDRELRGKLEAAALLRARELSWENTERKLFEIVEECAARHI
ncbi:glycosyltransferase [Candidatus Sumerlaeota bacterium]|nr:glycosyltransferase [Candidatus Sumerlaeota bacterium]